MDCIPVALSLKTAESTCQHDRHINTPLHIAIMRQDYDTVQSLLLHGPADVNLKNSDGKTALDLAKELNTDIGRQIVVLLLKKDKLNTIISKQISKLATEPEPLTLSRLTNEMCGKSVYICRSPAAPISFYKLARDCLALDGKNFESYDYIEDITAEKYASEAITLPGTDIRDDEKIHTLKLVTKANNDDPKPSADKSMYYARLSVPSNKYLEPGAQSECRSTNTLEPFGSSLPAQFVTARIDPMKVNSLDFSKNDIDILKSEFKNVYKVALFYAVIKGDIETVKSLLNEGADIYFKNYDGKNILETAELLNTEKGREIVESLKVIFTEPMTSYDRKSDPCYLSETLPETSDVLYLKKGEQLYVTKLLSLVFRRASIIKGAGKFILGTNLNDTTAKDLYVRYEEEKGDTIIFLQAIDHYDKDMEKIIYEDLWEEDGDLCLIKYFNSYLNKRNIFYVKNTDLMFDGRYEDVKCYFILYTTLKADLDDRECTDKISEINLTMRQLLSTNDENSNIFQYKYDEIDIDLLTNYFLKEHLKLVAISLLQFLRTKNSQMIMDYHMRMHHLLLAKKVIETTQSFGKFRSDFLTSNEEVLLLLREALYSEAVKVKLGKEEINEGIRMILFYPNADTISKLIGNVIVYNKQSKRLEIVVREINYVEPKLREGLEELQVSRTVVRRAMETAGFEKLTNMRFNIPVTFGKFAFNIKGENIKKSIDIFAAKLELVIKGSTSRNILIDENVVGANKPLKPGDMDVNSDIGFPIMDLLILDEDTNSLVFNMNEETLEPNALMLLDDLRRRIENLESYRLHVNLPGFPRLSFDANVYEKGLAKDFLNDLWFFTRQAKEDDLYNIAKNEILEHMIRSV